MTKGGVVRSGNGSNLWNKTASSISQALNCRDVTNALWSLTAGCILGAIATYGENDAIASANGWSCVLLMLPLIGQVVCAFQLRNEPLRETFRPGIGLASCIAVEAAYAAFLYDHSPAGGYSALKYICAIAAVIFAVQCVKHLHTMLNRKPRLTKQERALATAVAQHRFHAVWHYLTIFLCISHLMAFAVAFEDRATQDGGLYYTRESYPRHDDREQARAMARFFFAEGRANLRITSTPLDTFPDSYRLLRPPYAGGCGLTDAKAVGILQDSAVMRNHCNAEALTKVAAFLNASSRGARVRFNLMAHADRGREPFNFELTHMRAAEVHRQLQSWLSRRQSWDENVNTMTLADTSKKVRSFHDVEFSEQSVGSQPMFLDEHSWRPSQGPEWRMVEAKMEIVQGQADQFVDGADRGGRKTLLDYLYFMIYTITTTGYGDLVPISAFTKFVTSLANIFEIIFLVIFTNVIISMSATNGQVHFRSKQGKSGRTQISHSKHAASVSSEMVDLGVPGEG